MTGIKQALGTMLAGFSLVLEEMPQRTALARCVDAENPISRRARLDAPISEQIRAIQMT